MNNTSLPRQPDLPAFNLTPASRPNQSSGSPPRDVPSSPEWTVIENGKTKQNTKQKKIPKKNSGNYPSLDFSTNSRLQSQIKISDLQNLVLYILADGTAPQFISVRHRPSIRKVVVLMVPGLEQSMFRKTGRAGSEKQSRNPLSYTSPDEYYPSELIAEDLSVPLRSLAKMFKYVWPVKTPGDDRMGKMHSPLHAMLTAPLSKEREDKKSSKNQKGARPAKAPPGWKNSRTRVTEFIHTPDELLENDYVVHPASYDDEVDRNALSTQREEKSTSTQHGWVDSLVQSLDSGEVPEAEIQSGSLTAGREILAMDCEMCMTGEKEFSLTRMSLVGWDGSVVMDELVKPAKPIINYLTQYSGITEKMLADVTTTLEDIQQKLVKILQPHTILLGHSLNSDLTALQITHPFIIDTALLYPHPRGPPLKSSLKWLAQRYLNREIQKGGAAGHDSIEDARTCLDLLKQKCEKGPRWGTTDAAGENIFKRVSRAGVRYKNQGGSAVPCETNGKSSAAIDWGDPKKGPGSAATFQIGCKSDEEVVAGVIRAVKGDADGKEIPGGGTDFVWARMRELEALKGWWNDNKLAHSTTTDDPSKLSNETNTSKVPSAVPTSRSLTPTPQAALLSKNIHSFCALANLNNSKSIAEVTTELVARLKQIYNAIPPCTAFVIYSGSGDPREMSRLSNMHMQFKREYKTKKWDELSVKWTDTEEQALKRAVRSAREDGVGFLSIK
ncbi:hypothetical protein BJ875DRAFT_368238 [Amylocarpus encephaloides]|uniref:Exonuclease domain-containing protein n=1 Tax=Amylocarpus encephaloides TaxID=45428 RepID=A0A9P7YRB6_9HELO|nr:hypothetical protein BJ875DRAFT_368238 [Amylocarpus encephaloides]